MKRYSEQELADGLGVTQDFPPQQVQQIRQQHKMPQQVVGGFLMANFNHIDNVGRLKRPVNQFSARQLHEHRPVKQYELKPFPNMVQQNPFLQPTRAQTTPQPQSTAPQANFAGQYANPQQIDLNNATASNQSQTYNSAQTIKPNFNAEHNNTQQQLNSSDLKMKQAQQEIQDAQRKIQAIQQQKQQMQQQRRTQELQKRQRIMQRNQQFQR